MKWISKRLEWKASDHQDVPGQTEDCEPDICVLIPQKRAGDPTPTLPVLTSLDASFFEVAESTGFDPYNSGSFVSSKSGTSK